MNEFWQTFIVALVALAAGAWLLRRRIRKRRAGAVCDRCAATVHLRMAKRPSEDPSKASTR